MYLAGLWTGYKDEPHDCVYHLIRIFSIIKVLVWVSFCSVSAFLFCMPKYSALSSSATSMFVQGICLKEEGLRIYSEVAQYHPTDPFHSIF